MAKQVIKNYSFNAGAKTVTLTDFGTVALERLALITDTTLNQIVYNFADNSVATASVSGNVITLSTVPGGAANGDKLRIDYEDATGDPVYDTPPLPNGAATAANQTTANTSLASLDTKQPAKGAATTANSSPVNIASDQTVPVSGTITTTPSGTQTVSGTVTANAGTNLNTSALALDATLTGGTQKTKIVDSGGTNAASVDVNGAIAIQSGGSTGSAVPIRAVQMGGSDGTLLRAVKVSSTGVVSVDGSAVTQPVSGTVTTTPSGTQTVSGTVTANAGTNLNTSALALDTSVNGILLSQGSTTSGQKGTLHQGAVTTAAPSYTTGQTSPLSLDTAGNLRTSVNNAVTVSGTVTANAGTNLNTSALALDATLTGGTQKTKLVDSGGTNVASIDSSGALAIQSGGSTGSAVPIRAVQMGGSDGTNLRAVKVSSTGVVSVDGSAVTQPVSGTVSITANSAINNAQVSGTAVSVNNGTTDAGTQRVTLSSDSTGQVKLATGANTIGALTANQSVNTTQLAGTAVDVNSGNKSAGTQRMVIATDQPNLTTALNVGAAQTGTWTVQPGNTANSTAWLVQSTAATTGGATPYHLLSAATTNATNVKGSAGMVYSVVVTNTNAAERFLKFFDKATAPTVGTDVPVWTLQIPGNTSGAGMVISLPVGLKFTSGIGFAITGAVADNDATAISANDVIVNLAYA